MATLVEVGFVKGRMGITDPNGKNIPDEVLIAYIQAATKDLAEQVGSPVEYDAAIVRRFDGTGRRRLFLPVVPVLGVNSLTIGEGAVDVGTAEQYAAGTVSAYWDAKGIVYPAKFPVGDVNVKVSWASGYTAATLPANFKTLLAALAIIRYKERDKFTEASKNFADYSITYDRNLPEPERTTWRAAAKWGLSLAPTGF